MALTHSKRTKDSYVFNEMREKTYPVRCPKCKHRFFGIVGWQCPRFCTGKFVRL